MSIHAGYDKDYADDSKMTYANLLQIVKEKAIECSEKYPNYDIIFGEDTEKWSDSSVDSVLMIVMPWDIIETEFDEVGRYFEKMCYDIL